MESAQTITVMHQVAALVGYLAGSIPFGLILTKLAGHGDVRAIGSGNIGATNVLRTGNKALALATLILDGGKGAEGDGERDAILDAIDEVHRILTPAQRRALVKYLLFREEESRREGDTDDATINTDIFEPTDGQDDTDAAEEDVVEEAALLVRLGPLELVRARHRRVARLGADTSIAVGLERIADGLDAGDNLGVAGLGLRDGAREDGDAGIVVRAAQRHVVGHRHVGVAVRVEVFDMLGRRVRVLHDSPISESLRLTFDASTLSPGLYIVRAAGSTLQATRRAVLTQ